jgi:hypothetical protein
MWTDTGSSLSGTWNTVPYPDFDHFPVFSCFREHGTQSFIQILFNCQYTLASGNMEHNPLSRLCSIVYSGFWEHGTQSFIQTLLLPVYSCFLEHRTQSCIQIFINCQSTQLLGTWSTVLYPDYA